MPIRHRFLLIGVGVLVLLIAAALVAVPRFLNADSLRTHVEATLSDTLGRRVTLGKLNISLWSGSLIAQKVIVADDPAFSNQPFLQAPLVRIRVQVIPVIFSRKVHIESFQLVAPQITLLRAVNGVWNYASLGHVAAKIQELRTQTGGATPTLAVRYLNVSEGKLTIGSVMAGSARTAVMPKRVYDRFNLDVENFSVKNRFPFTASARLPDASLVSIGGTVGPIRPRDLSLTAVSAHIDLKHFNPAAAGVLDTSSGTTGRIDNISIDL